MYSDPSGHWLEGLKQGLSNISAVVVNEYKYAKNEVSAGINYVKNKFSAGIDAVQAFARNTTNEVAQYVDEKVVPKVKQGVSTTRQSITNGLNKGKSYAQKMKSQAPSYAKKGCEGLSVIGSGGLGNIDSQGTGKTEPINRWDYLASSGKQIVLGNYTNDVTALGTAGQIGTGLLGIDLPLDIRDLFYDVNKWEWSWSHTGKTTLDAAGLLPVVGGLKYTDKAATLINANKKVHGNVADDTPATLYKKVGDEGNFLKWGITKHEAPTKRYTKRQIDGGDVIPIDRGPRKEMLKKERDLVETNPGPDNHEPWAGWRK